MHVTGTFDDWGKSVLLDKTGDVHQKVVALPNADKKILYKVRSSPAARFPSLLPVLPLETPW